MEHTSDPLLDSIADAITSMEEAEISVTLTISGFLVSGLLIADQKYFSNLSDRFREAFDKLGAASETKRPLFEVLQDKAVRDLVARSEKLSDAPRRDYLHLRNVQIHGTDGTTFHLEYWRVRIEHISGYDFATADDPAQR